MGFAVDDTTRTRTSLRALPFLEFDNSSNPYYLSKVLSLKEPKRDDDAAKSKGTAYRALIW